MSTSQLGHYIKWPTVQWKVEGCLDLRAGRCTQCGGIHSRDDDRPWWSHQLLRQMILYISASDAIWTEDHVWTCSDVQCSRWLSFCHFACAEVFNQPPSLAFWRSQTHEAWVHLICWMQSVTEGWSNTVPTESLFMGVATLSGQTSADKVGYTLYKAIYFDTLYNLSVTFFYSVCFFVRYERIPCCWNIAILRFGGMGGPKTEFSSGSYVKW